MNRILNRRTLGLLGLAVSTLLLSACVVLPVPHHVRHQPVVVDVEPGYGHSGRHDNRHHRHRRHHHDYRH